MGSCCVSKALCWETARGPVLGESRGGQAGGGRKGRWVDPRPAVPAPDVPTPHVSGSFTGDAAAHTQLVGPEGQLGEVPPLHSRGSGARSLALGQC